MDNIATINREKLTEAFKPPRIKSASKFIQKGIPQTTILKGEPNALVIEGPFLSTTIEIEGNWTKEIELKTTEAYDLLKNKLPKSESVTIFLEDRKFWFQIDKLKVSITPIKI